MRLLDSLATTDALAGIFSDDGVLRAMLEFEAAIARSWRRLDDAWERSLVIQLGGAAGTLAALGDKAPGVVEGTARELGLRPAAPWHTDRDRLGAVAAACGLY